MFGIGTSGKRREEIIELFDEILRGYYAIRDSREEEYVDSYIVKLQYVSKSLELQKKIDELIQDIFQYKDGRYSQEYQNYLVIVVDDLDLNIEHGFEMLKQLQKYFSSSHILIVFSADYEQLNEICWVHFMKAFSSEKSHVIEQDVKNKCRGLGRDYIGKALPISKRIHMPDLNNGTREVCILDSASEVTVKQYVMKQIARKMKIYYDIRGKKRHYIEPDNIRSLVNYHNLLEELYVIDYNAWEERELACRESQIYMEQYDQNHERINKDIENRLVNHFLSGEQKKEFEQWLQIRLERRAESACIFMERETEPDPMDTAQWSDMDVLLEQQERAQSLNAQNDPTAGYSYGEFLQQIYEYGRLQPQNKAYVKCLLASLTSEMVREKICFSRNLNQQKREEAKYALFGLAGKSFGNNWLGEMMPGIRIDTYTTGNLGFRGMIIGASETRNLCQIPGKILQRECDQQDIEKIVQAIEEILDRINFIQSIEWLFSFLNVSELRTNGEKFPITLHIDEAAKAAGKEIDEEYVLQIGFTNVEVRFGIFEFIPRTLFFSEYLEILHKCLSQELTNAIVNRFGNKALEKKQKVEDHIASWVEQKSLFLDKKNRNKPIFPFYQVDYSYNVIKRARRELIEKNPHICERQEWLFYLKGAYQKVIEKMEEEEKEYRKLGIELDYSERFSQFPIVNMAIGEEMDQINEEIVDLVTTIFCREDERNLPDTYVNE